MTENWQKVVGKCEGGSQEITWKKVDIEGFICARGITEKSVLQSCCKC